jgi:AmiR/NasT family two-component response regulator
MGGATDGEYLSACVHQATGMISEQLGCEIAEALGLLRERAQDTGETLDDAAADVVARLTRFNQ